LSPPVLRTTAYPTRYVAFDRPGTFVIQENVKHSGGYELAYFRAPIRNAVYPHIKDGLSISVSSYQGKQIMVEYHWSAPNRSRQQKNHHRMFANSEYQEAINYALQLAGCREESCPKQATV
jgi:hypothetical protein